MKKIFGILSAVALGFFATRCGSGGSGSGVAIAPTGQGYSYSTTSNVGDYAEWTFTGATMTAAWKQISNVGAVQMTYNINATCSTYNSTYGYYTCSINPGLSSCTDGTLACGATPSGSFDMMEVPGVALFVHTNNGTSQLHTGLLKDANACAANVAGDYVFAKTALGSRDLFGLYRTDSNFINVTHADFGMTAASNIATPSIRYETSDAAGAGTLTMVDGGCVGGVRTRTAGPTTLRSMMTSNGLFILDLPSGQGGIVSFKVANAATLADFANRNFGGISFPDDSSPMPLAITMGSSSGTAVTVSSALVDGNTMTGLEIRPATNTTSSVPAPSYPNFTSAVTNGSFAYSANALQATYGNISAMPGVFRIDGSLSDSGRVVLVAAKLNNKVVAFGFVYNWRTTADTNPSTGSNFSADGLYNTGSFILFEK